MGERVAFLRVLCYSVIHQAIRLKELMESKVSQKLFNLNINFFSSNAQAEETVILKPGSEFESEETEIKPAADILEFSYPPESPFYREKERKRAS